MEQQQKPIHSLILEIDLKMLKLILFVFEEAIELTRNVNFLTLSISLNCQLIELGVTDN